MSLWSPKHSSSPRGGSDTTLFAHALDFSGATSWHNSAPLTGNDLIGQVTIVHFWSGAGASSLAAIPRLKAWKEFYGDACAVIGVHSPLLACEAKTEFLQGCLARLGVDFPVAADWNGAVQRRLSAESVPMVMLVDARGVLRGTWRSFAWSEIEEKVRGLLREIHREVPETTAEVPAFFPEFQHASSLLFGSTFNESLGSPESVRDGVPTEMSSVKFPAPGMFYLNGTWEIDDQGVTACSAGASLVCAVQGRDIYVFADAESTTALCATIDGAPLAPEQLGMSMQMLGEGADAQPVMLFKGRRVYHVATGLDPEKQHVLELRSSLAGATLFMMEVTK
jgi:hypothetical protein